MSPTKSLQSRPVMAVKDHTVTVQVASALVGLGFLAAGLWVLHDSEVTDVQFVIGMLVSLGLALTIALGGFVVAARKNAAR